MRRLPGRFVISDPARRNGPPLWSLSDLAETLGVSRSCLRRAIENHPEFFPKPIAATSREAGKNPVPRYEKGPFLAGWKRYTEEGPGRPKGAQA